MWFCGASNMGPDNMFPINIVQWEADDLNFKRWCPSVIRLFSMWLYRIPDIKFGCCSQPRKKYCLFIQFQINYCLNSERNSRMSLLSWINTTSDKIHVGRPNSNASNLNTILLPSKGIILLRKTITFETNYWQQIIILKAVLKRR